MNISHLPRREYVKEGESTIEPLKSLSTTNNNNVNVFIKRDDLVGSSRLVGGGNKARKLEFCMADALNKNASTIITCGAVQSNHCRLTLAACNRESLKCILVLEERVVNSYSSNASGNNYLFKLLGAEKIITVKEGQANGVVEKLAEELRTKEGRNVYVIPGGASNELGATGYAVCMEEIVQYEQENDMKFDYIVTASGSGGTHAGLLAGMAALQQQNETKIIGISTRHPSEKQTDHIYDLANRTLKFIKNDSTSTLNKSAVMVLDDYVGPGYSLPTKEMEEAVTWFARKEGILLDPVYSGKAAAGLMDLVLRKSYFPPNSNVLFLHTGGAPSIYHYQPLYREDDEMVDSKSSDDAEEEKKAADY